MVALKPEELTVADPAGGHVLPDQASQVPRSHCCSHGRMQDPQHSMLVKTVRPCYNQHETMMDVSRYRMKAWEVDRR